MGRQPDRVVTRVRIAPQDVGLVVAVEVRNTSNAPHRSVEPCHRLERIGVRRLPDDVGAATGAPPQNVGLGIAIEVSYASNLPVLPTNTRYHLAGRRVPRPPDRVVSGDLFAPQENTE